jgi:PilZ domain-containing protein
MVCIKMPYGQKEISMADKEPGVQKQPWRIPRKHPRVKLVTQVESRAAGATSLGTTENLGLGGLRVASRKTFGPGTEVIVRFNLPKGPCIEAQGVVVHAEPGVSMGIQFMKVNDQDLSAVNDFIQEACE